MDMKRVWKTNMDNTYLFSRPYFPVSLPIFYQLLATSTAVGTTVSAAIVGLLLSVETVCKFV